jgi:uncharacterized protein
LAGDYYRILSLDGGGAKGFYTLGVLLQVEAMIGCPIHERFNLIFGTSTGAIIASMLAFGHPVSEIIDTYEHHVLKVVRRKTKHGKSEALQALADDVHKERTFADVRTGVGIVTTRWLTEKPMIFKGSKDQAHGSTATFVPGFGVRVSDAVQASCSAYPFFNRKIVQTSTGEKVELMDGGYCANNPALYAIADAVAALKIPHENLRVVSIGVGEYPPIKRYPWEPLFWINRFLSVRLLQKTLEINTQSMEQLRRILFKDIATLRITKGYPQPEMATDLFEHNMQKLNSLRQRGTEMFGEFEERLRQFLVD